MSLVTARGIRKKYVTGDLITEVLKGIDVDIEEGEKVAILGSSGAGKSTLLHILSSLDRPSEGQVLFQGNVYPENDRQLSDLRNQSIGFVFQFHHLLPEFSALENVMLPLLIRGERRSSVKKKSEELLGRLGLSSRMEHGPAEMSGGEQQRVAVARSIVSSPKILFADEPTGNLDHENGEKLVDLLLELHKERQMTLVLVTHNSSVADRFSKKIMMEDGKVVS
jgi:lipoprotein-releasing system ATP-binding protein